MNTRDRRIIASLVVMTLVVVGFVSVRIYQFVHHVRTEGVDAKNTLHDLAWQAAQHVLRDVEPRPKELVVALRGALLYEAILIGPPEGQPVVHDAAMREIGLLYPYFAERRAAE